MTLQTIADEALTHFTRGEREVDGIGAIFIPKDPANGPQWITDLCREAHKDGSPDGSSMLPDDWRYEFISDVLTCLAEEDDGVARAEERFREWFDGAYIYTNERTAWLASRNDRMGYVDEAKEAFGDMDLTTSLWAGMFTEAQEVWTSVVDSLTEVLEQREEAG